MKLKGKSLSGLFMGAILSVCFLSPCQTACSPRQQDARPVEQDRFVMMDTNNDGKVVIEEFKTAFPNMNENAFIVIDKNGDKGIERAEWLEFIDNHGKSQQMPRRDPMNNIPGDPLIPPPDSNDLPLMRPPAN